jgi:hypothetical protein
MPAHNKVHIAGRGSVVRQLRIPVSQFRILRTGTLSEICNGNLQVTIVCNARRALCFQISTDFKTGIKKLTFV